MKKTKRQYSIISTVYQFVKPDCSADVAGIMDRLLSISGSLRKSYEFSCNYPQTEEQEVRRDKREERLENEAESLCKEMGMYCYVQTDPRGCSVYVIPPEHIAGDWNQRYSSIENYIDCNYPSVGIAVY